MSGEEPVLNFSLEHILIAAQDACKFCQLLLDSENYFTGGIELVFMIDSLTSKIRPSGF
jgi:hypothetical protein